MGRILVGYSSKAGATRQIAEEIGTVLIQNDRTVDVRPIREVKNLGDYDAVVLGSALYMGRWRSDAVRFLKRHAGELSDIPVWLFQSGPIGPRAGEVEPPPPAKVVRLAEAVEATGPVTFGGRLETPTARGFMAKRMARSELSGDYRDWDRITAWAETIVRATATAR